MSVPQAPLSQAQFALLQRVIRSVARHHGLSPEDAEDFGQTVHLKLLERHYQVFDSYEGRSSLTTFLTVVVTRLLLDWRNATRGKWRPSASAIVAARHADASRIRSLRSDPTSTRSPSQAASPARSHTQPRSAASSSPWL